MLVRAVPIFINKNQIVRKIEKIEKIEPDDYCEYVYFLQVNVNFNVHIQSEGSFISSIQTIESPGAHNKYIDSIYTETIFEREMLYLEAILERLNIFVIKKD